MSEFVPKTNERPEVFRGVGSLAVGEFPANWEEHYRKQIATDQHDTQPEGLPHVVPQQEATAPAESTDE